MHGVIVLKSSGTGKRVTVDSIQLFVTIDGSRQIFVLIYCQAEELHPARTLSGRTKLESFAEFFFKRVGLFVVTRNHEVIDYFCNQKHNPTILGLVEQLWNILGQIFKQSVKVLYLETRII